MYYGDADYDDNYLPENHAMPGGDADGLYDDLEDGFFESLIILGLAAALIVLLYWRQQHQAAHQREVQAARVQDGEGHVQQPREDRGLFPQPGDPDFGQWVAGGVGH
jgi:SEL1 protein